MSVITITDSNGSRIIDMAPVDELVCRVNDGRKDTVRELELVRGMNRDQLQYALVEVMGLLRREQGLTGFLYSKKGQEHVAQVIDLKEMAKSAGFELWSDCSAGV